MRLYVTSNHADLKYIADQFDIPFLHLPMGTTPSSTKEEKAAAKAKQEGLIEEALVKYKVWRHTHAHSFDSDVQSVTY